VLLALVGQRVCIMNIGLPPLLLSTVSVFTPQSFRRCTMSPNSGVAIFAS